MVPTHPDWSWNDNVSSVEVFAGDSDVSLVLFTGNYFDEEVYTLTCAKGQHCTAPSLGWLNDDVSSASCQREFPKQPGDAALTVIDIPTRSIGDGLRKTFCEGVEKSDSVEDCYLEETQVAWSNTYDRCTWDFWDRRGIGCSTHWTGMYRDELRITQNFEIDPNWWPSNYDVDLDMYFRPTNYNKQFRLDAVGYILWVESGTVHTNVWNGVVGTLNGSFGTEDEEKLNQALFKEVGEVGLKATGVNTKLFNDKQLAGAGQAFLNNKERVQLTHTCDRATNFNPNAGHVLDAKYNVCNARVPVDAWSPVLRLNADRVPATELTMLEVVGTIYPTETAVMDPPNERFPWIVDVDDLDLSSIFDDDDKDEESDDAEYGEGEIDPELMAQVEEMEAAQREADAEAEARGEPEELSDEELYHFYGEEPLESYLEEEEPVDGLLYVTFDDVDLAEGECLIDIIDLEIAAAD